MRSSKIIPSLMLVLATNFLTAEISRGMPHEYEGESTPMVSPQELNLIYGSLPHKKGEKFNVLARVDTPNHNGLPKYILLYRHSSGLPRGYLIVRLDTSGVVVLSETPENPFKKGDIQEIKAPLPILVACSLYRQCLGYISEE